jgi:hypothetical protein
VKQLAALIPPLDAACAAIGRERGGVEITAMWIPPLEGVDVVPHYEVLGVEPASGHEQQRGHRDFDRDERPANVAPHSVQISGRESIVSRSGVQRAESQLDLAPGRVRVALADPRARQLFGHERELRDDFQCDDAYTEELAAVTVLHAREFPRAAAAPPASSTCGRPTRCSMRRPGRSWRDSASGAASVRRMTVTRSSDHGETLGELGWAELRR